MIILYVLACLVGAGGLLVLYFAIMAIYDQRVRKRLEWDELRLDLASRRVNLTRPVYPDSAGNYPMLWDGQYLLDPGRGLLFTLADGLKAATPEVAKPEQLRRLLQGAGGWPPGAEAANLLGAPTVNQWPSEVPLKSVITEPDIKDLVLGVTVNGGGQHETVKADMGKLVHIAVGGSSGWGKSVFLRSLGYQLALSQTPVDLAMIDLEGATLAPFARCGRLLYPIADTKKDALAILQALQEEMERRKELYAEYPGVDSLGAYNARAERPLTASVAIIDEATALLGDKSVESALRTLALRARKYGLWLVMAGQDWKSSSLDTAIRNQLSSRIQFKAMSVSQSRVLLEQGGAETLDTIGRAMAILPGRELFTMQAPFVSAKTIMADVRDGGPRGTMPETNSDGGMDPNLVKRVKALHAEGLGLGAIADEVYGYRNARKTAKIKAILGLE
jgi:S-DNA-T family DNA segregation ATPase FtsK/SpoIIIE